jgi:hypothetical protein
VAVYDSKKKAGKGYQTPVIKKTLNPVWKDAEVLVMCVAITHCTATQGSAVDLAICSPSFSLFIAPHTGKSTSERTARASPCRCGTAMS